MEIPSAVPTTFLALICPWAHLLSAPFHLVLCAPSPHSRRNLLASAPHLHHPSAEAQHQLVKATLLGLVFPASRTVPHVTFAMPNAGVEEHNCLKTIQNPLMQQFSNSCPVCPW